MSEKPGRIILLGSGETAASIRKVYNWLFRQLNSEIHLAILETPAGFEPNSAQVAGQIADFMQTRLQNFQPQIAVIPARKRGTPNSPDNREIVKPLLTSNVIMMGPGSPSYAVRQLQDSLAWYTLCARQRQHATLIFASAATIAAGAHALPVYEIYKVGEDLHWKPGLNFFKAYGLSLVFIPHWNNTDGGLELDTSRCYMGRSRFENLVDMLPPQQTIVGLDEHTALVIDPAAASGQVMGKAKVTIIRDGQERVFPSGQAFDLDLLGPFRQLNEPQTGIPRDIWEWILSPKKQTSQREKQPQTPPPEVTALLEERSVARTARDWAAADALRAQIEAQGWQVLDTAEGSHLEPL